MSRPRATTGVLDFLVDTACLVGVCALGMAPLVAMVLLLHSADRRAAPWDRWEEASRVAIVIMGGQSNMDGRAEPVQHAFTSDDFAVVWKRASWADLKVGLVRGGLQKQLAGPELSFAGRVAELDVAKAPVVLVKVAESGSSLGKKWAVGPDGELVAELIDGLAKVTDEAQANGVEAYIAGMAWVHGETDATSEEAAGKYAQRLGALIERVREVSGQDDFPVVLAEVRPSAATYAGVVVEQQRTLAAADSHVVTVSSDGLTTFDGLHYDSASTNALGVRLADAMFGAAMPTDVAAEPVEVEEEAE